MIEVRWRDAQRSRVGDTYDDDGRHIGFLGLESWFEPGALSAQPAWVLDWMAPDNDVMQRSLVELGAQPVRDEDRERELSDKARQAVAAGPPAPPAAFGAGATGFDSNAELRELIELTSLGMQEAEGRLMDATRRDDEHTAALLNIAAVEFSGWLRSLDELMQAIWKDRLTDHQREEISRAVDEALARPSVSKDVTAQDVIAERQRTGKPYPDWTVALLSRNVYLSRAELQGWRWLAGKMLHHGPLSAVERRAWRDGAPPRWKWRDADDIYPPRFHEQQVNQRRAYQERLAGRDVLGTTDFILPLIETELMFLNLLPDSP